MRFEVPAKGLARVLGSCVSRSLNCRDDYAKAQGLRLKTDKPYVAGGPMGMELTGGSQQDRVAMKARLLKVPPRESNWPARAREISKRLLEAKLDIYLLQEVGF